MEGFNDDQVRAIKQLVECKAHTALRGKVLKAIAHEWIAANDLAERESLHSQVRVAQRTHEAIMQVAT
jgi:hypothetical protein